MAKATAKKRIVILAYTTNSLCPEPQLLRIYAKGNYQAAYNWIADLAERYGNAKNQMGLRYPIANHDNSGKIMCETVNPQNGQRWWLERWEVE